MADWYRIVKLLVGLREEAQARGDVAAVATIQEVADAVVLAHAELQRCEVRKQRDRERSILKLPARSPLREAVWERDKGRCVLCGVGCHRNKAHRLDPSPRLGHIDHVIPVIRGGANEIGNLRLLCKACHDIKSADERREVAAIRAG